VGSDFSINERWPRSSEAEVAVFAVVVVLKVLRLLFLPPPKNQNPMVWLPDRRTRTARQEWRAAVLIWSRAQAGSRHEFGAPEAWTVTRWQAVPGSRIQDQTVVDA
jgi:hypothetical protein